MRKMDGRKKRPSFIAAKPRCALKHGEVKMKKLLILAVVIMMVGCKTVEYEYIPVETVRTDTVYIAHIVTDSVYQHDSTYIKEKGDTVWYERWHTQYRDRLRIDTVYQARVDTIEKPYPVIKEVEKKLTKTQKGLMWTGGLSLLALFLFIVYKAKHILPF